MSQPNDDLPLVLVCFTSLTGQTATEGPMSPEEADAAIAKMLILHPDITAHIQQVRS